MFVELIDATSKYVYEVEVTEEEAIRVQNELAFAQQLLEDAKVRDDPRNSDRDEDSTRSSMRYIWSYKDTIFLIDSVSSHYQEIKHSNPKIKKKGWENISNDLLSVNVSLTIAEVKKKWSNLVQSYNKAKDVQTKSGGTPSKFNFFEKIDDILGDKASNSSPHTFDSGTLKESSIKFSDESQHGSQSILEPSTSAGTSSLPPGEPHRSDGESPLPPGEPHKSDGESSLPPVHASRKRNSPAAQYLLAKKQYLTTKQEELLECRKERQRKEKRKNEKLALLKERNVIEARKAKALEELVELKKSGK